MALRKLRTGGLPESDDTLCARSRAAGKDLVCSSRW
jgi:hypothetical protein